MGSFVQQLVILEYSPCTTNCLFVLWSVKAFTGRCSLGHNKIILGAPLWKKGLETQFWRHMLLTPFFPASSQFVLALFPPGSTVSQ
jgi:hypothetical protein